MDMLGRQRISLSINKKTRQLRVEHDLQRDAELFRLCNGSVATVTKVFLGPDYFCRQARDFVSVAKKEASEVPISLIGGNAQSSICNVFDSKFGRQTSHAIVAKFDAIAHVFNVPVAKNSA
jgi:hypothetical protein